MFYNFVRNKSENDDDGGDDDNDDECVTFYNA